MELRPLLAALLLLLATWIPWGLSRLPREAPQPCADRLRVLLPDADGLRGALPLALCRAQACGQAPCDLAPPRGGAGLLLGRPIDIDAAPVAELEQLPGVGPGTARRIAASRDRDGPFGSLRALRRVKGLGAARIRALEGWARAGPGPGGTAVADR